MNANQKRLFEEARKRNPDLKIPTNIQPSTEWTEADLALIKQGVGDKTTRSNNASGEPSESGGELPSGGAAARNRARSRASSVSSAQVAAVTGSRSGCPGTSHA